jgi:hypothetical protein
VRQLLKFVALSREDRRLLSCAIAAMALFRLGLGGVSIERLRLWAGRSGTRGRSVERIVWAIEKAARLTPATTCLSVALASQFLLSSNGHASELHVGVSRTAGKFAAHAWVEHEGRVLIGQDERHAYTRLVSWSGGGLMSGSG